MVQATAETQESRALRVELPCPLCRLSGVLIYRTGIREDAGRRVLQCPRCHHIFLEPREIDWRTYYREEYRQAHESLLGGPLTPRERFDLMSSHMVGRERLFRETIPAGAKVLEVGCSSGYFLHRLSDTYVVYGNEWNADDALFVRQELGIPCSEENLGDAFPGEKFTCIAAFHVLEHQPDPVAWLKQAKKRLVGGGWLYLEVPNVDDALVSLYDIPAFRDWYFRESHLHYFNMHNLNDLIASQGFESIVRQRQDYSVANHLSWMLTDAPQKNINLATGVPLRIAKDHPARNLFAFWFAAMDAQYRGFLDTMKACNVLVAVGRSREI